MQTGNLPVCNIGLFDEGSKHFWIRDLNGLLDDYPILEQPHKNNFYTLLIVTDAQGEVSIDNQRIALADAKTIVIKPRCINSITIKNNASGKVVCFSEDFFSLRYNNNILNQFSFLEREARPAVRLSDVQRDKIDVLLNLLQEEYLMQKSDTVKVLRSYLNIFLFELDRLYIPQSSLRSKNPRQEKIHLFQQLIEKHFATKKLPSTYADMLNVSTNYLNKLCKEETGLTAGDIIRNQVIIEAQRLLHYTNLSIKEIASKLGFENTSYFVTLFKKLTQQTPEQFRKNQNL